MKDIHILDIGARDGLHPRWKRLEDRLIVTACDADVTAPVGPNVTRIPGALWSGEADITLHLTRSPGCSSVYPPNRELLDRIFKTDRFDVLFKKTVPAKPLDFYELKPDFIKLDTQGSELDILRGGEKTLACAVGVEIEVEFLPMYRGQPLFAEVDTFLRDSGFELHDINRF